MSIEEPEIEINNDMEAALGLINENPFLKNDPYAKRVVESGGTADNGQKVDIGDFLNARLAVLEMNQAESKVMAAKTKNPQAYEVAYSVAPDKENYN